MCGHQSLVDDVDEDERRVALQLVHLSVGASKQCNNSLMTPFLDYHTTTENYNVRPGEDVLQPHTVVNCEPLEEVDSKPQKAQPIQPQNTHGSHNQLGQYSYPQNNVDNQKKTVTEPVSNSLNNVPKWGTDVGAIAPWSEHNRGEVTPCGKFYICLKGKLYKSYEHMNAVRRQMTEDRFKASVENYL